MTLVELMITGVITAVVFGAAVMVSSSSSRMFRRSAFQGALEEGARRALERMVEEIQKAGMGTIAGVPQAPLWSDSMNFDGVEGVSAADGSITWSPSRLQFEYEPGELNNGIDDNGNGLVDEGRIVLIRWRGLPDEKRIVLARWVREYQQGEQPNGADDNGNGLVDERGVNFSLSGTTLTIRLTLERRDPERRLLTYTVWTTVQLRN